MFYSIQSPGIDLRWEDVKHMYRHWSPATALLFEQINAYGIDRFAELFQFKHSFMEKCKKGLVDCIAEFSQFEANTLEEIYQKMVRAIQTHNALNDAGDKMSYVNCIHELLDRLF